MDDKISRIAAAFEIMSKAIEELKSLGVLRSRKGTSDFSEWLVAEIYRGTLAKSKTQKGWDVATDKEKIQVKVAFVPDSVANRWSYIGIKHYFDSLVLVVLTDAFKVRELYKIPKDKLIPLLKNDEQGLRLNWKDLKNYQIHKQAIMDCERLGQLFDDAMA